MYPFPPPPYFFVILQPVLSESTASKVKGFGGIPMSTYTLGICGEIFQVLDIESQKTPLLSPEGIKTARLKSFNMMNQFLPSIEPSPKEMSLIVGEEMIDWLRIWHHCDEEEKSMLREYQDTLIGEILNLQVVIVRGGRDE